MLDRKKILFVNPPGMNWVVGEKDVTRIVNIMPPVGLCSLAAWLGFTRLARVTYPSFAEQWDEGIRVCETILSRDNCWEGAYRLLMKAYAAQDNRPQVHSVYQRCTSTLDEELGVEPSPTTLALFEELR